MPINTPIVFLQNSLTERSNKENALAMSKYMKNLFPFYGVKSPERKLIFREFWSLYKPKLDHDTRSLIKELWLEENRESQYIAMDILGRLLKQLELEDLDLIEWLVVNKSWWDTVDFLASNPIGAILKKHPEKVDAVISLWMDSDNMWLQRSCLLFQLKYKEGLNFKLLEDCIIRLKGSKEFFINKAIGWSLRQHSKIRPEEVKSFLNQHLDLNPLSRREASKYIS